MSAVHEEAPNGTWDSTNPHMHVGTQRFSVTDEHLGFLQRCGVNAMAANRMTYDAEIGWNVDELGGMKEKAASYGVDLEMVALPLTKLSDDGESVPHYMRGDFDKGEKEVEMVCKMVKAAGEAGIPAIKYYLCEMENQRTETLPLGRGGVRYSTWDLSKSDPDDQRWGETVSADQNWERVTFFLERVIPVAEKYKVRMACHPCDPWLPAGYRGVDRILGGYDGFSKFIEICESPYHGLNLCLGCMAESVENPREDVPKILRYFGEKRKIHLIHYRNIIGGQSKFQEVYPDEGDMDMQVLMQTLKDVGYPHMVVPDHAPQHEAPGHTEQAFAFQFGFIKAMMLTVK
jgi:mannonate dehydratase